MFRPMTIENANRTNTEVMFFKIDIFLLSVSLELVPRLSRHSPEYIKLPLESYSLIDGTAADAERTTSFQKIPGLLKPEILSLLAMVN